jgi:hypothetical protein
MQLHIRVVKNQDALELIAQKNELCTQFMGMNISHNKVHMSHFIPFRNIKNLWLTINADKGKYTSIPSGVLVLAEMTWVLLYRQSEPQHHLKVTELINGLSIALIQSFH